MAGFSPRHAAAAADGGQDALGLPDALGAGNMHTKDTLETSDEHDTEDPLSKGHSLHTTEANKEEDEHDVGKAMHAVLDTSELLEMVLSHLSTKDLTRALTVSKVWQKCILGSIVLRRTLFLEPVMKKEYLDCAIVEDRRWVDSIIHEPNVNSQTIVELHPILATHPKPRDKTRINSKCSRCDILSTVQPLAFLVQPPLEEVKVAYYTTGNGITTSNVKRTGGVTFGAILKELVSLRVRHDEYYGTRLGKKETFCLEFAGVIASNADLVKTAREALMKAQSPANVEKLELE